VELERAEAVPRHANRYRSDAWAAQAGMEVGGDAQERWKKEQNEGSKGVGEPPADAEVLPDLHIRHFIWSAECALSNTGQSDRRSKKARPRTHRQHQPRSGKHQHMHI
jgi:hypothetical protein